MQDEHAGETKASKDGLAEAKVQLKGLIETLRPMFGEWKEGVFADLWLPFTEKEDHGLTPSYAEYQSLTTKSDRLEYLSKSLASLQLELDLPCAKYPPSATDG